MGRRLLPWRACRGEKEFTYRERQPDRQKRFVTAGAALDVLAADPPAPDTERSAVFGQAAVPSLESTEGESGAARPEAAKTAVAISVRIIAVLLPDQTRCRLCPAEL